MVLFFSATGNTEFIARQLASQLGDDCLNLLDRIRDEDDSEIHSEKPFVFCTPVYVCEMPVFFASYLKKVKLSGNNQVYFVFTSGGYTGISGVLAKQIIKRKGMTYMGRAEFQMPSNYLLSKRYFKKDTSVFLQRIQSSYDRIPEVAEQIHQGERVHARHIYLFELLITLPFHPVWTKYKQPAWPFHATEKCVGCGKCERVCPLRNISMQDGKPEWKRPCAHCMACIGNCPVNAIEYGDKTQGLERYRIGKYVKAMDGELEFK